MRRTANPALPVPGATVLALRGGTNHMLCFAGFGLCAVAGKQLDGRRDLWQNCRLERVGVWERNGGGRRWCFAKQSTR